MKKIMKRICILLTLSTIILFVLYQIYTSSLIYTLLITLFTTSYHFDMRMIVGYIVDMIMHNQADYSKKWYHVSSQERLFYRKINIKKWKEYMPTYSPERFDLKKYALEDIVQTMCQSEIVHSIIVILSFVPLCFIYFFGTPLIFLITSILAALFDLLFVLLQRYNRDRIIRMLNKRVQNGKDI